MLRLPYCVSIFALSLSARLPWFFISSFNKLPDLCVLLVASAQMLSLALALLGRPMLPSSNTQSMVPAQDTVPPLRLTSYREDASVCNDFDNECPEAAARGACRTAAEYMLTNCRSSCEVCSARTKAKRETPASPSPECKRLTVGSEAMNGRMRGHRAYCSERYSEDMECQGRRFGFARLERGRDSWDVIEQNFNGSKDEPRIVFEGPNVSQASHNTAFLCNGDGTVTTYGGRIKASSRYAITASSQSFYHDHFPGLQRTVGNINGDGSVMWSRPELILDEQKAHQLLCLDMRKGVEVCEFDGKLSATNFRGNTYLFGRANMAETPNEGTDYGGRHVQFSSHPVGDPNGLEPFASLHFEDYRISNENNIYFMAVMSLRDEIMVGLMPAIIDGKSGIFLSYTETGVLWSTPQLIMESEAVGPRTCDFPVDGFTIDDYRLVFSVDHNIYLEHDDACDAPPFTCTYEVTGSALQKLLRRSSPAEPKEQPKEQSVGESDDTAGPQETSTAVADGSCQQGIHHRLEAADKFTTDGGAFACCPASCGSCGGGGCENRAGGMSQCCVYSLVAANVKCQDSTSVACIVAGNQAEETLETVKVEEPKGEKPQAPKVEVPKAEPKVQPKHEPKHEPKDEKPKVLTLHGFCSDGIPNRLAAEHQAATGGGAFACCPSVCGVCGGIGCERLTGGPKLCCTYGLVGINETCTNASSVACIVPSVIPLDSMRDAVDSAQHVHIASPPDPKEQPVSKEQSAGESSVTAGPPETSTAVADGSCQDGILRGLEAADQAVTGGAFACCPASCGSCGGGGCESRAGGMSRCCAYALVAANERCQDSTSVACIVAGDQAAKKLETVKEKRLRREHRSDEGHSEQ